MAEDWIDIQQAPISLDASVSHFLTAQNGTARFDGEIGALVTFSGIVRKQEDDRTLQALHYEHYESMALKEMTQLAGQAQTRWPLRRLALLHRIGNVPVGETSVIVIVAAGHRAEAFEAARFLIDELKKKVPIWKSPIFDG